MIGKGSSRLVGFQGSFKNVRQWKSSGPVGLVVERRRQVRRQRSERRRGVMSMSRMSEMLCAAVAAVAAAVAGINSLSWT